MSIFSGTNADPDAEKVIREGLAGMHEYVHREMERLHQMHQLITLAESPKVTVTQMKEIFAGLKILSSKEWNFDS